MLKLNQVTRAHVELTTKCNARCPMCPRNYRGYDYNSGYPVCELSLQNFQHIFTSDFLHQLTDGINFNGNLGDFASARDAVEIVEYIISHNVCVSINTNGSLRNSDWWQRLALPGVTIGFSLDGLADTHALYRQGTDWKRIIANAGAFINAGGQAKWRFVPFEHNQHQEQQCQQLAKDMGFIEFENIYDGRDRGAVYTRTGDFSHHIGQPFQNIPVRVESLLENHLTWFDHKKIHIDKDTPELNLRCQHKTKQEIYIAADGSVYPCCYLGFYPGQMNHPGNEQLLPMVHENNALQYSLEHCMNWFDQVEHSWSKSNIADGRLYQCVNSCNQV